MFFLSWFTARGSGTGSVCLITDTDSPKIKIIVFRRDYTCITLSPVGNQKVIILSPKIFLGCQISFLKRFYLIT